MARGGAGTEDGTTLPSTSRRRTDEEVAAARRLLPLDRSNPALDRLANLAARLLASPGAQVSLLTEVQTVVGGVGLPPGAVGSDNPLDESLCTVTANLGAALVVPDARSDSRVAELPPVVSGLVGSYLGVPVSGSDGVSFGALCVFGPTPRSWSDADVTILEQLAASTAAELELASLAAQFEASRARWELATDAAGIGTFDWDLVTGQLLWDDRLLDLFGYDETGFDQSIEAFNARVHPDDLPRVSAALQEAIETCGTYDAEYRVVVPSRETRWVQARGRVLGSESGHAVRVLGAAYETTEVREGEARIARVLEAMPTAFFSLDRDWRFTYVNAEAERVLGRSRAELLGGELWELFPTAVGTEFETQYRSAVRTGTLAAFEAYYPAPLDAWYEVRAWPGPDGLSVYFLDVTARRTAQERAEHTAARAALLAEVTAELTETLDPREAVARLSRLVVPALADWCIVTIVEDGTGPQWRRARDIGWWHRDPDLRPVVERYAARRIEAMSETSFLARALETGEPVVVPQGASAAVAAVLAPGDARDLIERLAPESAAVLPLLAHGRTVGLLTLCRGRVAGQLGAHLDIAREVAARAGLALENARLYTQQRRLAEGLQRSLLTAPPKPDHMQVSVRYEPAAEAAQVGGDWYDAFLQRTGTTMLVIGDVVGHDTAAAAAMGQVRGLLRGIAATTGEGPAAVLQRLDVAMELLQVGTTASAVVGRFEQTPDERARGVTRLRWSNAGHPPPMAITPDGEVLVLDGGDGADPDVLLGIDATTARAEFEVTLPRDATVLLYTDGLVERRGQLLDEGLAKLRGILTELVGRPLDELCDELLDRMRPAQPEDDVALAAVRLHRQDRPRPPEAGPNCVPPLIEREQPE
ncbi:MAG: SpoIIE family protein phosphatase [Actinomycetota bacterium]|nr:SpoIIE family protein phosphatase [Actinomycetota bacterium]